MRTCPKCGEEKPDSLFRKSTTHKKCKSCLKDEAKIYKLNNPEIIKQTQLNSQRKRRLLCPEKIREVKRKWEEKNREKVRAYKRKTELKYSDKRKALFKKKVDELDPMYIRNKICNRTDLKHSDIPDDLVNLVKEKILLHRVIEDTYFSDPTKKPCSICGVVLPVESFFKSNRGRKGRDAQCKKCKQQRRNHDKK